MSASDREWFEKADIPYTRESFIAVNYFGEPPDPWTMEDEADLPEDLQDWSIFEEVEGDTVVRKRTAEWRSEYERKRFEEAEHPRDEAGKFAPKGGGSSGGGAGGGGSIAKETKAAAPKLPAGPHTTGFVSPNVGHLNFDTAREALDSPTQMALAKASTDIDRALGIDGSSNTNAIGSWLDDAENSIIVDMPGASHEQARVAMAMKGHLAHQKSVLLFEPGKETAVGHRFDAAMLSENHPETAKAFDALVAREDHNTVVDGKTLGKEGGVGFILPNGDAVLITDSHSATAREAGSSLDDFLEAGAIRFQAAIDRDFGDLAVHVLVTPTREQIDTLAQVAAQRNHQRFFIDAPMKGDAVWVSPGKGHEATSQKVTAREVRMRIGERFPETRGEHFLASFNTGKAASELRAVHDQLLKSDIAFHTLELADDKVVVHVYGSDQETLDKVGKAAISYGTEAEVTRGRGEFVGTVKEDGTDAEQRDDARRVYDEIIAEAHNAARLPGRDIGKIWQDARRRWGTLAGVQEKQSVNPSPS